jgi:hypothetical protein
MARKQLDGAKKTSRVIRSYGKTVKIRCQETDSENFAEEYPFLRPVTKQRLVKADLEDVL